MPKALCIFGLIVSVLVLLVFGIDVAIGFPFQKASMAMDITFLVAAAMLGYMSWSAMREQK